MAFSQLLPALASSFVGARSAHLLTEALANADAPPQLLEEIRAFAERNLILPAGNPHPSRGECCQQCLKAHALVHAQKQKAFHLPRIIHKTLKGKDGHNGYYLDNDEVKKVL